MILSVLCIYHHYGFTWYHWFWSIWSLKKVDFAGISSYPRADTLTAHDPHRTRDSYPA